LEAVWEMDPMRQAGLRNYRRDAKSTEALGAKEAAIELSRNT
jgi:hypothetical protein